MTPEEQKRLNLERLDEIDVMWKHLKQAYKRFDKRFIRVLKNLRKAQGK